MNSGPGIEKLISGVPQLTKLAVANIALPSPSNLLFTFIGASAARKNLALGRVCVIEKMKLCSDRQSLKGYDDGGLEFLKDDDCGFRKRKNKKDRSETRFRNFRNRGGKDRTENKSS